MQLFDTLRSLLESDRSIRRFDRSRPVTDTTLRSLVDLTRYCASGRNLQPLRYRLVTDEAECATLFQALAWAGYYKDWDGPSPDQRPTAYLIQCLDTELTSDCLCDDGLQVVQPTDSDRDFTSPLPPQSALCSGPRLSGRDRPHRSPAGRRRHTLLPLARVGTMRAQTSARQSDNHPGTIILIS